MTCPDCGHVYPISNGIANMVRISCSPLSIRGSYLGLPHQVIGRARDWIAFSCDETRNFTKRIKRCSSRRACHDGLRAKLNPLDGHCPSWHLPARLSQLGSVTI